MKGRLVAVVALTLIGAATTCWGDPASDASRADGFVEACKAFVNSSYGEEVYPSQLDTPIAIGISAGYCSGYINGLFFGSSMVAPMGGKPLFCKPDNVTVEQFAKVLIQEMDSHPAVGSAKTSVFVTAMLMKHWPCKKA